MGGDGSKEQQPPRAEQPEEEESGLSSVITGKISLPAGTTITNIPVTSAAAEVGLTQVVQLPVIRPTGAGGGGGPGQFQVLQPQGFIQRGGARMISPSTVISTGEQRPI